MVWGLYKRKAYRHMLTVLPDSFTGMASYVISDGDERQIDARTE